jgi:pyruvate formate lyase activating enzyme
MTGGEQMIQKKLDRFLETLKDMRYLIKVDTDGSKPDVLDTLISKRLIDYLVMDIKGPLEKYEQITSEKVDTSKIPRSIELITTSEIEHEFRTTLVRSQIDFQDLLSVAKLIDKSCLYILQPFFPTKTLNEYFFPIHPNSLLEFSAIQEQLENKVIRVVIR